MDLLKTTRTILSILAAIGVVAGCAAATIHMVSQQQAKKAEAEAPEGED